MDNNTIYFTQIENTILGTIHIAATDRGVCRISFRRQPVEEFMESLEKLLPGYQFATDQSRTSAYQNEIEEYLSGDRKEFTVPIDLETLTDFEKSVLQTCAEIPFGEVMSYGEIASRIGRPGSARAVGNALSKNPVPIIVPCHRVIAADGSPGGFTGGIRNKEALLTHEGVEMNW